MRVRSKASNFNIVISKNRGNSLLINARNLGCEFYSRGRHMFKLDNVFNKISIDLIVEKHIKDYKVYGVNLEYFNVYSTKSFSCKGRFKTLIDCEVAIRLMEGGYF